MFTRFILCRFSKRIPLLGWLLGASVLLCGCATKEFSYTTKIADGQRITFRMVNGRIDPARADGVEILPPQVFPEKDHQLRYLLGFNYAESRAITRVQVEDVSDDKPMLILVDEAPRLQNNRWVGRSEPYGADAPELLWVSYLDQSFRVFRFTVTFAEGKSAVLHQGVMYANFSKELFRHVLKPKPEPAS